eukprot:gene12822-12949_t
MSGALRRASGFVLQRIGAGSGRSLQQQRANHDLSVHPNKHVEAWLSRREDIEREFRWTSKTVRDVVLLVLVLPTLAYNAIVWQAHKDDEYGGRTKRLVSQLCAGTRRCQ